MAKIKQPTDDTIIPAKDTPAPEASAERTTTAVSPEKPAANKEPKTEPVAGPVPDALVSDVLRAFSGYETLYVDRHGGAFSPDTPPSIRTGAVLYRNPFFKP